MTQSSRDLELWENYRHDGHMGYMQNHLRIQKPKCYCTLNTNVRLIGQYELPRAFSTYQTCYTSVRVLHVPALTGKQDFKHLMCIYQHYIHRSSNAVGSFG